MIFQKVVEKNDKTWWMSWVGDKNKPITFWCVTRTNSPDAYPANQWDTKHKLFSLAGLCARLISILVVFRNTSSMHFTAIYCVLDLLYLLHF